MGLKYTTWIYYKFYADCGNNIFAVVMVIYIVKGEKK